MFLAVKDIRRAVGRFSLMGGVVGLLTLLLVMLTGLTSGLGAQNTSALESLGAQRFVFSPEVSFTESQIGGDIAASLADAGVATTPLGITQTRIGSEPMAVFGLPAGTAVPGGTVPDDGLLTPAETGVTEYYSHLPVAWASLDTWRGIAHAEEPTVLLASSAIDDASLPDGVTVTDTHGALRGLPAYQSERGSLVTMQGLLYAISALVVLAFLTVWTIQRTRDIAVLRALGASKGYVLRDSLSQAGLVVGAGVAIGAVAATVLGWFAARAVPFELSAVTVVGPAVGVFALGIAGALIATRKVAATDPQIALGV